MTQIKDFIAGEEGVAAAEIMLILLAMIGLFMACVNQLGAVMNTIFSRLISLAVGI